MFVAFAALLIGLGERPSAITNPNPTEYSQWLTQKTIDFDAKAVGTRCENASVMSLGGALGGAPIYKAPPPEEFITTSFVEHLKIEGCGHVRFPNILVFRLTSGAWRAVGLLDGGSHTSPALQRDALKSAAPLLQASACPKGVPVTEFKIGEVKFLRRNPDKGWSELWPAMACGNTVAVEAQFSPDGSGGTNFVFTRVGPNDEPLTKN
jgi:hypothetical protein